MNIMIILAPLLSLFTLAPQDHLVPLPLHNGETTNGANWGWLHPETRNGGSLESTGAARVTPMESDSHVAREFFTAHVVALDAGAAAITPLVDASGKTIELVPGGRYQLSWSQGALADEPPPILAVYLLDQKLNEVPGTRTVSSSTGTDPKDWKRQHVQFTLPADLSVEWGYMIAFQNLAKPKSATDSIAVVDKVSMARIDSDEDGYRSLFDGKTLEGWTGAVKAYQVKDGAIELDVSSNASGNLYTSEEFDDFILRFEFKLTEGANNGVGIRAPLGGDAAYEGMEIQVLENSHSKYEGLKPWQYHGSIYGVAPARRGYQLPPESWNYEEIQVRGRELRITLNGEVILDVNLDEATKDGTLSGRDHPGLGRTGGHIAFCGHGDEVAFRNIRIRPLEDTAKPQTQTQTQNRSSQ